MKYLVNIILSLLVFVGAYNYLPLDLVSFNHGTPKLGSTITTILGTDTLSASRTVINTNFSNLNTDKIESTYSGSLSSLTGVGTLTSGTWNATAITAQYGGTGRATLTSGAILYGNGTGQVSLLGPCSDNQVPLYTASVPGCGSSAIDGTQNYNWTGTNTFKIFTSSTTIRLSQGGAGYTLIFPTSAMTASSVPKFLDTSGTIVYEREDWGIVASTTLTSAVASTTLTFLYSGSSLLHFEVDMPASGSNTSLAFQFNGDTGANYAFKWANANSTSFVSGSSKTAISMGAKAATGIGYRAEFFVNNVPTRTKEFMFTNMETAEAANAPDIFNGVAVWNNTTSRITSVTVGASGNLPIGTRITVMGTRN